jgi:hypothetical protein
MGYTREQKREYDRQWMAKRRERGINLLGGRCVRCDSVDRLEFDHVDPLTKHPLLRKNHQSTFWSWAWSRIEEELAKCQLLCHDCHAEKTGGEYPKKGELHPSCKLTEDDVRAIRASGEAYRKLGEKYGVDHTLIYQIKKHKIWTHI